MMMELMVLISCLLTLKCLYDCIHLALRHQVLRYLLHILQLSNDGNWNELIVIHLSPQEFVLAQTLTTQTTQHNQNHLI